MAPTFTFKLGTLDLSSYCRMNPDDKFDVYGAPWLIPAWTETPYADGQPLLSTTVGNREMQIPLYLKEASKDLLHELVRKIGIAANTRPLEIEWQDDSASKPTFYPVGFCRFEPDYNFRRSQYNYAAGILHIWVSGYGTTGTTRVTATAAGTGIFLSVPIGSIAGDAPALLDTTITAGAVLPTLGRIVAVAPITNPSYSALIPAASLVEAQGGATLIGASGAQGSQYLALPVSPTGGASGVACRVPLQNPTVMGGDNRLLAVVNANIVGGVAINALDPYGNSMGATAVASALEGWSVVDLGVCRLPTVGYPTQPQISIQAGAVWASGAAGPVVLASPGLDINEVICLPDKNLALFLESHGAGGSVLSRAAFGNLGPAIDGALDDVGNPWEPALNNAAALAAPTGMNIHSRGGFAAVVRPANSNIAGGLDANRIGAVLSDTMLIRGRPYFGDAMASGFAEVRLFKDVRASQFVQVRLAASGFLSIETATGGAIGNVLASVAVATLATGVQYALALQLEGPKAFANLSRVDGGPVFAPGSMAQASIGVASNAAVGGPGAPALAVQSASSATAVAELVQRTRMYSWEVLSVASSNLAPYDSYRIDGPDVDAYRTASSGVFGAKITGGQRGAIPKAAPSTTSVAVVCAPFDQGVANDKISAVVSVRERFFYAR
jgi:hypothetical protein